MNRPNRRSASSTQRGAPHSPGASSSAHGNPPPAQMRRRSPVAPAPTVGRAVDQRLLWLGVLAGVVVFGIGIVFFAFRLGIDGEPGAPLGSALPREAGEGAGGGEFIQAVAQDAESFNPLFATDATAQTVMNLIYPRLLGQDPTTGLVVPTELAERWEVSADGRSYTFFLRDAPVWSDGVPVTAQDFIFTYTALGHPAVQSPFQSRHALIESMHALDDHTLVVTLRGPNCAALHGLRHPLLPSHAFAPDFSDLRANALNDAPALGAGPFLFRSHTPGVSITLARNPNYWKGAPRLDAYSLRIVPEPAEQARLLADGEIHLAPVSASSAAAPLHESAGSLVWQPQPGYFFLAANLADPAQPQAGRNELHERHAPPPHPLLGDTDVRRALALAIDTQTLMRTLWGDANANPGGYSLGGYLLPTIAWANPEPPPLPVYDPQQARQLLDAAGWTADATGARQRAGAPLALRLMTNQDNATRVAMAQFVAAALADVGVQVRLELLPFEAMTGQLLAQRFDLALAGWDNLAPDPGLHPFWHSREDIPDQGFNFVSLHDPQIDDWLDQALTLPGCGPDARGQLYSQIQARVQMHLPYLVMIGEMGGWAVADGARNVAPGPWQPHYNVQEWGLAP